MNATSPWRFDQATLVARLELPGLTARLDPAHAGGGLHEVRCEGISLDARLLCPQAVLPGSSRPAEQPEIYQRGDDVVATYPHTEARPLRGQVYWRALSPSAAARRGGIELIVSQQTHLLDSNPRLEVISELRAGEVHRLRSADGDEFERLALDGGAAVECEPADGCGCFVVRPSAMGISYVELVHPSDFCHSEISQNEPALRMCHRLFVTSLEKGVILRARLRGFFVDRESDLRFAAMLYRELAAAPPPLTT